MRHPVVYAMGLLACSACVPADMDADQVVAFVNAVHPTGISSPWKASGELMPCPCNDDPARRHWLLEC